MDYPRRQEAQTNFHPLAAPEQWARYWFREKPQQRRIRLTESLTAEGSLGPSHPRRPPEPSGLRALARFRQRGADTGFRPPTWPLAPGYRTPLPLAS